MDETASNGSHQRNGDDSEASLRAELLGKVLAAESRLEAAIAELRAHGESAAGCELGLSSLNALRQGISSADPRALSAMRAQVASAISESRSALQGDRTSGKAAEVTTELRAASQSLAATSAATRSEVQSLSSDLFDRHLFDRYLSFTSADDQAEYRSREAETKRYIDQQMARHTADGDLNAAGATAGQMLDAQAHGAGKSPDFLPRWNKLTDTIRNQRDAMRAEGQSTDEFDRNLKTSVRRYLKAKGLTDAQIEARLTGSADPLDVVKPFLASDDDAKTLDRSIRNAAQPASETTEATADTAKGVRSLSAAAAPGIDEVMAKLRSSGIVASNDTASYDVDSNSIAGTPPKGAALGR